MSQPEMNPDVLQMKKVPMPPPDGAPFGCTLLVNVPKPYWLDECRKPADEAYRDEAGRRHYRCSEHWDG